MKTIELVGSCGKEKIVYELRKPFEVKDFWQVFYNGDFCGSISKHESGWFSRSNPAVWIGEFEIRTFIEAIEQV